jgi:hypothetical protein
VGLPEGKDGQGAIIVQGGQFGGWSLYVKDGVPHSHGDNRGEIVRRSVEVPMIR